MMAEEMAPLGSDIAAGVLRQWASLARIGAGEFKECGWEAMQPFIGAATLKLATKESQMEHLLDMSNARLAPVLDPLLTQFGLHRWLKGEREEAYSDWLEWILQQLWSGADILNVLDVSNANFPTSILDLIPKVKREVYVTPEGGPPARRLDLLVQCDESVLAVIEVKVVPPEKADLDKDKYYWQWARSQNPDAATVLLALDGDQKVCSPFVLLTWARLCLNLRRLLPKLREQKGVIVAALTAAFVGAAEQNLLAFSDWPPDPVVFKHIQASL